MPDYPSSHGDSRDEASKEAAHQEEDTTSILDGEEGWLRQRVSDGEDNCCCEIVLVPTMSS
jgi:hypothetical protein